jgi:hypothetical protein
MASPLLPCAPGSSIRWNSIRRFMCRQRADVLPRLLVGTWARGEVGPSEPMLRAKRSMSSSKALIKLNGLGKNELTSERAGECQHTVCEGEGAVNEHEAGERKAWPDEGDDTECYAEQTPQQNGPPVPEQRVRPSQCVVVDYHDSVLHPFATVVRAATRTFRPVDDRRNHSPDPKQLIQQIDLATLPLCLARAAV